MKLRTLKLGTLLSSSLAGALLLGAVPVHAESERPGARKWSQPGYDATAREDPLVAPEMENFPSIPNDEDEALFDGDGRLIDRRGP